MIVRCVVLLLLLAVSATARAQVAPIFLDPSHWSQAAIRRLDTAGLAPPASDPMMSPLTIRHARGVFAYASVEARSSGRYDLAALADAYLARLAAETDSARAIARLAIRTGWASAQNEAVGGDGYVAGEDLEGARALESLSAPSAAVSAHGHLHRRVSWQIDGGWLGDDWALPSGGVAAAIGPLDVWAGRRRLHFGAGRAGGIVLGSAWDIDPNLAHRTVDTFDGIGLHVREPFHFPWLLRVLGPARVELAGGRLARSGRVDSPWLVFGRLVASPLSDRFTLGINRGAIFGGSGNPITAGRLLGLLIGLHGGETGEFENQVFSIVMRYRPPLGPLPLAVYAEYGTDDTAGALADVPAYVVGMDLGALEGLPALSLGLEHTRFTGSCCGNPPWYRNVFFRGSWADDGRLFAHPLGGHGYEWRAHSRIDMPQRGLIAGVDAFRRWRGHENLFAPERQGYSYGSTLRVEFVHGRTAVSVDAGGEWGSSWDQHRITAMVSRVMH